MLTGGAWRMKKWYFFLIIILLSVMGVGIYILTNVDFERIEESIEAVDNPEAVISGEIELVTLGDFIKEIILASVEDVDYDLMETELNHYAAPYLAVAENYEVIEKNIIDEEMLENPISKKDAIKICSLCDINIRHHEMKQVDNSSTLEDSLLSHALAIGLLKEEKEFDSLEDKMTITEFATLLAQYKSIV